MNIGLIDVDGHNFPNLALMKIARHHKNHLPQYTASVEELADIAISALTELYARVDNVEEVIVAKINYNKTRV